MSLTKEEKPCRAGHTVDGKVPMLHHIHLDQRTCDCGRMIYYKEKCGCSSNPHYELKSKPNE